METFILQKQPEDMDGDQFMRFSKEINAVVHENAEFLGGSFSAEHGIGSKLKDDLIKYSDPTKVDLMKKIKKTLDPKNIMNPDKLIDCWVDLNLWNEVNSLYHNLLIGFNWFF